MKIGDLVKLSRNSNLTPVQVGIVVELVEKKCWRTNVRGRKVDWSKIKPHLKEVKYDKEMTTVEVIEWTGEKEMWPTPSTQDNEHLNLKLNEKGRRIAKNGGEDRSLNLADKVQVREQFSTPRASQATKPVNKQAPSVKSGSHGSTLEQDVGERNPELIGQRLNPEWVTRLMGFPSGWLN